MTLREALARELCDTTAVTDICSTRVYWERMPQGVIYPAVSFSIVPGGWNEHTMGTDSGPIGTMVQVSCWNSDGPTALTTVESLAAAVKTKLKDFTGELGDGTGTVTVERIFVEGDPILIWQDDAKVFAIHQEYMICYTEE